MRLLHASHRPRDHYLVKALVEAGHVVEMAGGLDDVAAASAGEDYDAILLEVADLADAPLVSLSRCADRAAVVLVAEQGSASARARALRSGADACLVRPVHVMELEARLVALVRLAPTRGGGGELVLRLDAASRTASLEGRSLALPSREYALLTYMAEHAGEVVSAEQILKHVWGEGDDPRPERVRTAMARLRTKLDRAFEKPLLVTLRGHGYRLDANMTGFSSG